MIDRTSQRRWTLRGRMLRWMGLTSGFVAVGLSLTGIWFVDAAAKRQVEALLIEELDEVRVEFEHETLNAATFGEIAKELDAYHPGSGFAWRVWSSTGDGLVGEFGEIDNLRPDGPRRAPLDVTMSVEGGYRWRATQLSSGEIVGLILDEAPQKVLVDQYILAAVVLVVTGFTGIFLVGRSFSTKISDLLARIALRARQVEATAEDVVLATEDLPEEIAEVAVALEEMLKKIRSETEASRLLIAGMAHELRAPLQNLIGETEVTLMAERSDERYRDVLASHLEEMRHLGDAVHNLVALCSAKKSAESKDTESFDLYREARLRLEREVRRAERMGVTLSFRTSGDPWIRGDREGILTAMRNLLSNALDWTPTGGEIEFEFEGKQECISISVSDSGPGIPVEAREEIFKAFVRGPSSDGRRVGYGLGLALTREAIAAQGGSIEVGESSLGGAKFVVQLPRDRHGNAGTREA